MGKSPRWRTWARRTLRPGDEGEWRCDVLNEAGQRLGIAEFEVESEE